MDHGITARITHYFILVTERFMETIFTSNPHETSSSSWHLKHVQKTIQLKDQLKEDSIFNTDDEDEIHKLKHNGGNKHGFSHFNTFW